MLPSSSGLGHRPLTPGTGVQTPLGVLKAPSDTVRRGLSRSRSLWSAPRLDCLVRRILAIPLVFAATGCNKPDVAAEMEASLLSTNHAIGISLIVADVASYHLETPSEIPTTTGTTDTGGTSRRHGELRSCPELFALSDSLIEVDYGTGCLPRSGLVPVVVAGAVIVERSGDSFVGDFDTYAINLSHPITGSIAATITGADGDLGIDVDFDLKVRDGGDKLNASGSVSAKSSDLGITVEGKVKIDEKQLVRHTLRDVKVRLEDIPGECPEPKSGTGIAHRDSDAIVDYAQPGGGHVTVNYGKRTSDDVRLCAFDSWIF